MAVTFCLAQVGTCQAHFLWLVTEGDKVHVYFSEMAKPDDPSLLDRVTAAKVWAQVRDGRKTKTTDIEIKKGEESLVGTLPEDATVCGLTHNYGLLTRGDVSFLLKYSAKIYTSPMPADWKSTNDAERLPLEVTPKMAGQKLQLLVTWKGKPLAGSAIQVEAEGMDKFEGTTNAEGLVECEPVSGVLSVRAKHQEEIMGELDGKAYSSVRHYSTLTLNYAKPAVTASTTTWPVLPKAITSFGGAVIGDHLYVYGGQAGGAHQYSSEEQSGDFRRLSLNGENAAWENLPGGPKLTGLALVPYEGKLYRVGGFTVKNAKGEDSNLVSQSSFAQYDPATQTWTDLVALPEARSSHDAAVLDGKLYVVGGWQLKGEDESEWHTTAWVCDLTKPELQWVALPSPSFQRRAVSLAAYQGKIFVSGGMDKDDGPSLRVDIFDTKTNTWSQGPSLQGSGMEGFGNSAFEINGKLVATSMSGAIQQLSDDGKSWAVVGQLNSPRFFHRLLSWHDKQGVIVGGGNMQTGKTDDLELLDAIVATPLVSQ